MHEPGSNAGDGTANAGFAGRGGGGGGSMAGLWNC